MAAETLSGVLDYGRPFEDAFAAALSHRDNYDMEARDRAFARLIAATVLRRKGELQRVLDTFLNRPVPERSGRLRAILLSAAAQLLVLETPAHAAISVAVDQCRAGKESLHFAGLANAVLRKVATEGPAILAKGDPVSLNVPPWMATRWRKHYGHERAQHIGRSSLSEAALDLSVKSDAEGWAQRLGGEVLPSGSVRLQSGGRIEELAGYAEGAWWVQDAAAALPARLLGDVAGKAVADLCAAPGGKTCELVSAGARVTAVDQSAERLKRLEENLKRMKLEAETVTADVLNWNPGRQFDAVLLDAPCTATGTIRRHPDILHLKREGDVSALAELQLRLLNAAALRVAPGGLLVYCTCSLEPEECEDQITGFLERSPQFERVSVTAGEAGIAPEWISPHGDLRTLPYHLGRPAPALGGMDGFFASRIKRLL